MATRPSLEDLLKDVPPEKLDQPCTDAHLSEIALSLTEWHSIAPFLGLTEAEIEEIQRNHAKTSTQKIENVCKVHKSCSSESPPTERIFLDSYAIYLRGRYRNELPMFFTLQWPPPPTHKIFHLVMIHQQTVQRSSCDEELVRLTLRGNVDDILKRKTEVKLENIFNLDNEDRKVILIEGAPGAGKSTLAWDVCRKWESGVLFQEFRIVIFVQLRDPAIQSAKSLADILPARSGEMCRELQSAMEACNGDRVLFVLDGWDEYGTDLQARSLFQQLICTPGEINMHFSSLVITSRPISSAELQHYASSRVEIVGFTPTELDNYLAEAVGPGDDGQRVLNLQDYLREHPMIQASCYLPLTAAIVVHLFIDLKQSLPNTLHEVFTSLVLCLIIRHLKRQSGKENKEVDLVSLDGLPSDLQEPFYNICAWAFHAVMKNKATFSEEDLQSLDLPSRLSNTLSLIQGVECFRSFKKSISYNFIHLLLQELLAAFHISKLPVRKQIQVFNELFDQPRLAAVFRFYAAFTKLKAKGVRDIVVRMIQNKEKHVLVNLLHCLYEAQDLSLCKFVVSHLNGELDLSDTTLSPMDCLVVGYFLSCVCLTASRELKVDLSYCSIDKLRISFLVGELSKCSSSLKPQLTLNFKDNRLSDGGIAHVAKILANNNCVRTLNASDCDMDDLGMKSLATSLGMNDSLEKLVLNGNAKITHIGLTALGESLKRNHHLKELLICDCGMGDKGMESLVGSLATNCSLETLYLSVNNFSDDGMVYMCSFLQRNRCLRTLYMANCGIGDEGLKSLATSLETNSSLKKLDLSQNVAVSPMTGVGLLAIGESLKKNEGLKALWLKRLLNISEDDWKQFLVCLQENKHLLDLQIPSYSYCELVCQETERVNQIRKRHKLSPLNVMWCPLPQKKITDLRTSPPPHNNHHCCYII